MARKKKTLGSDFSEVISGGKLEAFKKYFESHEINAHVKNSKINAFYFDTLTPAHIRFLIESGLDPDSDCGFQNTAAAYQSYNIENLKCLIKYGADVNKFVSKFAGCPLVYAVNQHNPKAVKNLLECGADPNIEFYSPHNNTVLDELLMTTENVNIVQTLECAKILLAANAKYTDNVKAYIHRVGESFEFYRAGFDPRTVEECSNALDELYSLFEVEPVPHRVLYDGKSKITVKSKTWQTQHAELWNMLVPGSGHATTVQGELIRIAGRVSYEIIDNGAMNWDMDYRLMCRKIPDYINMGENINEKLNGEICTIARGISSNTGKTELNRLTELIVKWILQNPEPIELKSVCYTR